MSEQANPKANAEEGPVSCCCCSDKACDTNESPAPHQPSCPDKTPCQGICGGAVVVMPSEWDGLPAETLTIGDVLETLPTLTATRLESPFEPHALSARNYGRTLRTLYDSFLC